MMDEKFRGATHQKTLVTYDELLVGRDLVSECPNT